MEMHEMQMTLFNESEKRQQAFLEKLLTEQREADREEREKDREFFLTLGKLFSGKEW